jgi:3',5'-cyclic AMP phosphodiesterase CpdA
METTRTLAHLSDLHVGRDAATDREALRVRDALLAARVDDVLVTGDVTHRGRAGELATFERLFAPLRDRLHVVPGNHDRLGDDVAGRMIGGRVEVERRPGLHVVRADSTAPHNRALLEGHGDLSQADVAAIEEAVGAAPRGALVVLMLHHHLLPLPPEGMGERLANLLGWPNAAELSCGRQLLARLRGRCDLVAHGHRHVASELRLGGAEARPLRVMNAGCTTQLGRFRVVAHAAGRILSETWLVPGLPVPREAGLGRGLEVAATRRTAPAAAPSLPAAA